SVRLVRCIPKRNECCNSDVILVKSPESSHGTATFFHPPEGINMSCNRQSKCVLVGVRLFAWTIVSLAFCTGGFVAADKPLPVAKVNQHVQSHGRVIQALSFQLPTNAKGEVAHDHLIYIDTSASQIGDHRLHSFAVLNSLLKALPKEDRVRLF